MRPIPGGLCANAMFAGAHSSVRHEAARIRESSAGRITIRIRSLHQLSTCNKGLNHTQTCGGLSIHTLLYSGMSTDQIRKSHCHLFLCIFRLQRRTLVQSPLWSHHPCKRSHSDHRHTSVAGKLQAQEQSIPRTKFSSRTYHSGLLVTERAARRRWASLKPRRGLQRASSKR